MADLIIRLRDIGLQAIFFFRDFGLNFFTVSIGEWLGVLDGTAFGSMTMFEVTCLSGVLIWLGVKIVQWLI